MLLQVGEDLKRIQVQTGGHEKTEAVRLPKLFQQQNFLSQMLHLWNVYLQ